MRGGADADHLLPVTTEEKEELRRLRRENRVLHEEKENIEHDLVSARDVADRVLRAGSGLHPYTCRLYSRGVG